MCALQLQSRPFFSLSKIFSRSPSSLPYFSTPTRVNYKLKGRALLSSLQEFHPPNALRRKTNSRLTGGFSLGVDLGLSRTGLALSKGFSVRPLTVLKLRGQKLELQLLDVAEREEADEFIIGLPKSWDGKESPQSNKVRSIAGRLAVRAAQRQCLMGWRVYLVDEHGTSSEAECRMINLGLEKSARQKSFDAYAAVVCNHIFRFL
ncbi:Shaggy-related protein kinase delta [Hibiscus syriacus]|uniref:Shaggy-related protein kinase delta n=1 Tax=Hibiscus syriacus TaxID=106335 RepID=A0A6A3C310_HIBSY|nr:Shaggy-related protein kinase delta [Hibiscus syriacus]